MLTLTLILLPAGTPSLLSPTVVGDIFQIYSNLSKYNLFDLFRFVGCLPRQGHSLISRLRREIFQIFLIYIKN